MEKEKMKEEPNIFTVIFAWLFCIPIGIAMYAFGIMAVIGVLITFSPFWVLSSIVNLFNGGKNET
jgi:hypothetical protein